MGAKRKVTSHLEERTNPNVGLVSLMPSAPAGTGVDRYSAPFSTNTRLDHSISSISA
jgi:hypothetical protein